MSNIINTGGNIGVLKAQVLIACPVDSNGNTLDGVNIFPAAQVKANVAIFLPVDENGNAV